MSVAAAVVTRHQQKIEKKRKSGVTQIPTCRLSHFRHHPNFFSFHWRCKRRTEQHQTCNVRLGRPALTQIPKTFLCGAHTPFSVFFRSTRWKCRLSVVSLSSSTKFCLQMRPLSHCLKKKEDWSRDWSSNSMSKRRVDHFGLFTENGKAKQRGLVSIYYTTSGRIERETEVSSLSR